MTVPVALAQFLNSDESPWDYMTATAIMYADLLLVPPLQVGGPDHGWRQGVIVRFTRVIRAQGAPVETGRARGAGRHDLHEPI